MLEWWVAPEARKPLRPIVEGWTVFSRDFYRQHRDLWRRIVTYGVSFDVGLYEWLIHR